MDQFDNQDTNNQNPGNPYQPEQYSSIPAAPVQSFTLNLTFTDLKSLTGWATFRAIIEIIVGALSCLGIITAAYGVPQIISGVKLLNAVDELKRYIAASDAQRISDALRNLQRYFKLGGIATIVKICFGIVFIILYAVIIGLLISQGGDFMRDFTKMQNF
jgi:hypothetical protein